MAKSFEDKKVKAVCPSCKCVILNDGTATTRQLGRKPKNHAKEIVNNGAIKTENHEEKKVKSIKTDEEDYF